MAAPSPEEQRWRLALETAAFGVWDLDPQLDLVHYSPQWKARLGLPAADAADSTSFWRQRVHPQDLDPMLQELRSHIDGFSPSYEMQFRLRDARGAWRHVLSRGRVVERDERGSAMRVVGTMIELAERPAASCAAAAGQAPAAAPSAPDPRARLSHELRTPLHSILGMSYLLARRAGESSAEEQRRYLACIDDESRRLLGKVDDLLDIACADGRRRSRQ